MKIKRFIFAALVLGASFLGWRIARQQPGNAFIEGLRAPSPDQVRKWAGLSERTHLTMFTNLPADAPYSFGLHPGGGVNMGKFTWLRDYEDRKGSNYDCFVIAVYESGAFWPSNRASLIPDLERMYKKATNATGYKANDSGFDRLMSPMTMPNGQKSYGLILGLGPARFALHPKFDILAFEFGGPVYDSDNPPADLRESPTNSFYTFFTNVDAFIANQ